jgi:hypothetical protein
MDQVICLYSCYNALLSSFREIWAPSEVDFSVEKSGFLNYFRKGLVWHGVDLQSEVYSSLLMQENV